MIAAWIIRILEYIPGIGAILEKIGQDRQERNRAEEIMAQIEREDMRGFHRTGRISARHLWRYARIFIALIIVCAFVAAIFFIPSMDMGRIIAAFDSFAEIAGKLSDMGI